MFVTGVLMSGAGGDAASVAFDVAAMMTTTVSSVQSQLFTVLNIVVPAIVGVMAAVVCVQFGMNWLKKMGKK